MKKYPTDKKERTTITRRGRNRAKEEEKRRSKKEKSEQSTQIQKDRWRRRTNKPSHVTTIENPRLPRHGHT